MLEESPVINTFSGFGYLDPFRRYSRSNSEVVWNWLKFCMFLAPNFVEGMAPNFWTCIIKNTHIAIMWQSFAAIRRGSSVVARRIIIIIIIITTMWFVDNHLGLAIDTGRQKLYYTGYRNVETATIGMVGELSTDGTGHRELISGINWDLWDVVLDVDNRWPCFLRRI